MTEKLLLVKQCLNVLWMCTAQLIFPSSITPFILETFSLFFFFFISRLFFISFLCPFFWVCVCVCVFCHCNFCMQCVYLLQGLRLQGYEELICHKFPSRFDCIATCKRWAKWIKLTEIKSPRIEQGSILNVQNKTNDRIKREKKRQLKTTILDPILIKTAVIEHCWCMPARNFFALYFHSGSCGLTNGDNL